MMIIQPAYLALYHSGELAARTEQALTALAACQFCPRLCGGDRLADETHTCKTGRLAIVASHGAHFGEETALRGKGGSGTIFFSQCNLRCVFCQNCYISQNHAGQLTSPQRLASIMLELQRHGCHNINLVTPSHVVPQILEALLIAVEAGLRLPLVYNTSGYDSLDTLRLLDGVVDIYMPDFKFWDVERSLRYLAARDYPEVTRQAIKEMHRQVGVLQINGRGLAQRGVLVRHLVMPDGVADAEAILTFLAQELSPDTYVNVMAQYRPAHRANQYPEINRQLRTGEYLEVLAAARRVGLRLDEHRQLF